MNDEDLFRKTNGQAYDFATKPFVFLFKIVSINAFALT